jgi:hypothetical protein
MSSTTENRLKSKYDSSSKKIKELYEEFSAMKTNLYTPSKKSNAIAKFFPTNRKYELDIGRKDANISLTLPGRNKDNKLEDATLLLNSEAQSYLLTSCLKTFAWLMGRMGQKMT